MKGDLQLPSDVTASAVEPSLERHSDLLPKLNEVYSQSFVANDAGDRGQQLEINKTEGKKSSKKQKKLGQGIHLP